MYESEHRSEHARGKRLAKRLLIWTLILGPVLALLAIPATYGLRYVFHVAPFRGEVFAAERWHAAGSCLPGQSAGDCAAQSASCPRGAMVEDLVMHSLQRARSDRDATRALLGEPDRTGPLLLTDRLRFRDCDFYLLGQCSGLGIDDDALYICFSTTEVIDRAGHVRL